MLASLWIALPAAAADVPIVSFERAASSLRIVVGGEPVARYVFDDPVIPRPYFCDMVAPGGTPLTRHHPPREGLDATDHATFHPGIWMAFGDLSGADFWRNRARVLHRGFVAEPEGGAGQGSFAVRNDYVADDKLLCHETCRINLGVRPERYLLVWDSEFRADERDFYFGDQEEMGLGIRLATPLTVAHGGEIVNSDGLRNEAGAWGNVADWCSYSGTVGRDEIGVLLAPDPKNFRRSWFHVRDYGLLVANPFGRHAFTGGELSRITVKKGDSLRVRCALLLWRADAAQPLDKSAAAQECLALPAENGLSAAH